MKIGLAQWELNQIVQDLKAGKSWDEIKRTHLVHLDPKALEASDYKEYAHREAGIEQPADEPPAKDEPEQPAEEPELEAKEPDEQPRGRGKRGRG